MTYENNFFTMIIYKWDKEIIKKLTMYQDQLFIYIFLIRFLV